MHRTGEIRHAAGLGDEVNLWDLGLPVLNSCLVDAIRAAGTKCRYVVARYPLDWEKVDDGGDLFVGSPGSVEVISDSDDFLEAQSAYVVAAAKLGAQRHLWGVGCCFGDPRKHDPEVGSLDSCG